MGRKGPKQHLKRLASPVTYPIERKFSKFVMRPKPSGHTKNESVPLGVILRDVLGKAKNLKELKYICNKGNIEVDGRVIKDYKFSIGPMDIIRIKDINECYRFTPTDTRRRLSLEPIAMDTDWKLCKINNKRSIKKDLIQFVLHDGRNIVIPRKESEDTKTKFNDKKFLKATPGGTFKINIPSQEIGEYYPLEEGAMILVDKGVNRGKIGKLVEIEKLIGKRKSIAVISVDDEPIRTALENIFVIGKDKSELVKAEVASE